MFFPDRRTGWIAAETSVLLIVLLLRFAESSSSADLVIEPGQLVTGHMTILDNVTNHGALVGTGNTQGDRIEVGSQYRVTGSGLFQNTLIRGTFAPGNSPGVVNGTNQAFGGTLEIELGGTSPGFSANNHDQINDSDTILLLSSPTLSVLPFNSFVPTVGDQFEFMTWQTELQGSFGALAVDPFFTTNNIAFTLTVNNPGGMGSAVLTATAIAEARQVAMMSLVLGAAVICQVGRRWTLGPRPRRPLTRALSVIHKRVGPSCRAPAAAVDSKLRTAARHGHRGKLIVLLASATLFSLVSISGGVTTFTAASGNWNVAGNWDNGIPGVSDSLARIGSGAVLNPVVTMNTSQPQPVLRMSVGRVAGANATLNFDGGALTVDELLAVGINGNSTGAITQTGASDIKLGGVADSELILGQGAGDMGSYTMQGGSLTSASLPFDMILGGDSIFFGAGSGLGTGTFDLQSGSVDTGGGILTIGSTSGGTGHYNQSGGSASFQVMSFINGTISFSGGTLTLGNQTFTSAMATALGPITAGATLNAATAVIPSGVTLTVDGGTFSAGVLNLTGAGASFVDTSGAAPDVISLGLYTGSSYTVSTGMMLDVPANLTVDGTSSLTVADGALDTNNATVDGSVTVSGNGSMDVGTMMNSTGTVTLAGGTLMVRNFAGSGGTLNFSSGTLSVSGTFSSGNTLTVPVGGTLSGGADVTDSVHGLAGSIINAGGTLQLGDASSATGFQTAGRLHVNNQQVTLRSSGPALLGSVTTLGGGTLTAAGGVDLGVGEALVGAGSVNAALAAAVGSTIQATGNLTIGDAAASGGFSGHGRLLTGPHTVVLNDDDQVDLGTLTQLGDGVDGGTLTAGAAVTTDTDPHFFLGPGRDLTGRGEINGNFRNNGAVSGDGTALDERIVFNAPWIVSGKGTFANMLVLGTFSPGESPGIVETENAVFGGMVEIELGGLMPGAQHDQINDLGRIQLLNHAVLSVSFVDDYVPQLGDEFTIMTWQAGIDGRFADLIVDPSFANLGVGFHPHWLDSTGAGSLKLVAVLVPEPTPWILAILAAIALTARKRRQLQWKHLHLLSAGVMAVSVVVFIPAARATIIITGNTSPTYGGQDPWNVGGLAIGDTAPGSMTINSGSDVINSQNSIIAGSTSASTSSVIVDGAGSTWTQAGSLLIGYAGTGTLTVTNGGSVSNGIGSTIGTLSGGNGTATIGGGSGTSTWTNFGSLGIGQNGTGTLNITSGGIVDVASSTVVGANGTFRLQGGMLRTTDFTHIAGGSLDFDDGVLEIDGGTFNNGGATFAYTGNIGKTVTLRLKNNANGSSANLEIGQLGSIGSGRFELLSGADFTSDLVRIGRNGGSDGSAIVDGNGSLWTTGAIRLGENGTGALTVQNGGDVNATGTLVTVGHAASGVGTLLVTGSGSTMTIPTIGADFFIGNSDGTGTVTIANSGLVDVADLTNLSNNGRLNLQGGTLSTRRFNHTSTGILDLDDGVLEIDGGTFDVGAANFAYTGNLGKTVTFRLKSGATGSCTNLEVGQLGNIGAGRFELLSGATFDNAFTRIARNGGSDGSALVDGNGSVWTTGAIRLGENGTGALTVQNGGRVDSDNVITVGHGATATGDLLVTGSGSIFTTTSNLVIGNSGSTGTVTVASSGLVDVGGLTTVGAVGRLNLQGGTYRTGGFSHTSTGILDLDDGVLEIDGGGFNIGGANFAYTGNIGKTVTLRLKNNANGSSANLEIGQLGSIGSGRFELLSGADFTSDLVRISRNGGSDGSALVDGNGSLWTTGAIRLGENGMGVLTVQNGGDVNATGTLVTVGHAATGVGTLLVTGSGSTMTMPTSGADLFIGNSGGTGTVTIANSGLVDVADLTNLSANGRLNLQGGTLTTRSFSHTSTGILDLDDGVLEIDGGTFNIGGANFAYQGDASGKTVTLRLAGGASGSSGDLEIGQVGSIGAGRFELLSGSTFTSALDLVVGKNSMSMGSVDVADTGSQLSVTGAVTIGDQGTGAVTIGTGGSISSASVSIGQMGTLTLGGGTLATPSIVSDGVVTGAGSVAAAFLGLDCSTITPTGAMTLGDAAQFDGFVTQGTINLGGQTLQLQSAGLASLGAMTTLAGGILTAANGVALDAGDVLAGHGAVSAAIAAAAGSTIQASGGNLSLGDASAADGFYSEGTLATSVFEVTLQDANLAVLGASTTLGNGSSGGTLTAGTAMTGDALPHLLLNPSTSLGGRGQINGNFKNNGTVTGDGTALDQRITFNAPWIVNGIGTFTNTLVLGTFAPGESPGISIGTNQAFGGTVEFELGGLAPGNGAGHHDQVQDTASITLLEDAVLRVVPYSGFAPQPGDTFDVMTWQESLLGQFARLSVDEFYSSQLIGFDVSVDDPNGNDTLTLTARVSCDFNGDQLCDLADINQLLAAGDLAAGIATTLLDNGHYDMNYDGVIDGLDLDRWLADAAMRAGHPSAYLRGDADLDGFVDGIDFTLWNMHKFQPDGRWDHGDFDGDGQVDGSDFLAWNANKFTSVFDITTAVPEPVTSLIWCAASLAIARLCRGCK